MIGRAIAAELVKIATVRATKWLLAGSIAAALALTVIVAMVVRGLGASADLDVVALAPLTGFGGVPGIAITGAAVIGVLSVTTEIRYNTLRSTFLAVPRRWVALSAKTIVVAAVCALGYGAAMIVCAVVFGILVDGSALLAFGSGPGVLFAFPLATAVSAVLGVAVGCALRNGAGAITLLLGYLFVVDNVVSSIPQTSAAAHYLLLSNLQNLLGVLMSSRFPWSAAVSAVYLVVVVGALWAGAVTLISRRDA